MFLDPHFGIVCLKDERNPEATRDRSSRKIQNRMPLIDEHWLVATNDRNKLAYHLPVIVKKLKLVEEIEKRRGCDLHLRYRRQQGFLAGIPDVDHVVACS